MRATISWRCNSLRWLGLQIVCGNQLAVDLSTGANRSENVAAFASRAATRDAEIRL
jgi:hypothetical protein